jgi:cytochrome P450
MYSQWTLALEPPEHTRQRALLNHAFTGRVVEGLCPALAGHIMELLAGLDGRAAFDVVGDYAFPLTLRVITDLLGVPQADAERVKGWSLTIAAVLDYKRTWDIMAEGNRMTADFTTYLGALVAERRQRPRPDLISRLVLAEAADDTLSEAEVISLCAMLLFAGHETTVNLISAGTLLLLEHPDQRGRLDAAPGLIDSAVDEVLRLHSPIQATSRIAYADVTLRGRTIRRGESVTLLLGSANRDPAAFAHPDRFDIARRPNRHLAFGRGSHFCLGAPLAMAQGGLALRLLLGRFPALRPTSNGARWSETFGFRGLERLVVAP